MFGRKSRGDADAQLAAISRSHAVIEFAMDGTILTANQNFLNVLGYSLDEIKGKKHVMFVPADQRDSAAYKAFWGRSSTAAKPNAPNSSGSPKAAARSGSRPATIRCSTMPASPSRS